MPGGLELREIRGETSGHTNRSDTGARQGRTTEGEGLENHLFRSGARGGGLYGDKERPGKRRIATKHSYGGGTEGEKGGGKPSSIRSPDWIGKCKVTTGTRDYYERPTAKGAAITRFSEKGGKCTTEGMP